MGQKRIAVVGLGYVGLPLARLAAKKGYQVYGIDNNKNKLEKVKKSIDPITNQTLKEKIIITEPAKAISLSDIIIVCVPTPVNEKCMPDFRPLISAVKLISENLKKGHLIV